MKQHANQPDHWTKYEEAMAANDPRTTLARECLLAMLAGKLVPAQPESARSALRVVIGAFDLADTFAYVNQNAKKKEADDEPDF